MTASSKQTTTRRKTKNILLVCSLKLSIYEVGALEELIKDLAAHQKNYKITVPLAKDDTFYFLVHLLNTYGCLVNFWKTSGQEKVNKAAKDFLGRRDASMLTSNYDKFILVGDSTRLDNLAAYLDFVNKSYFVVRGEE